MRLLSVKLCSIRISKPVTVNKDLLDYFICKIDFLFFCKEDYEQVKDV